MDYQKLLKKMGEVYKTKGQWPMRDNPPKETINRNAKKQLEELEDEEKKRK